jgi:cytoskeletal protein CcmA (bactofilin family)
MREVRCYHCSQALTVPPAARNTTCPACYRPLTLDDIQVVGASSSASIMTVGQLVIESKARPLTKRLHAGELLEIRGHIDATASCDGHVRIAKSATASGELRARSLVAEKGATFVGMVQIGPMGAA